MTNMSVGLFDQARAGTAWRIWAIPTRVKVLHYWLEMSTKIIQVHLWKL